MVKLSVEVQKKFNIYTVSSACGLIATLLICYFGLKETWLYSAAFSIGGAGIGCLVARVIWHIYTNDNGLRAWLIHGFFALTIAGWMVAVWATSTIIASTGLAVFIGCLLMAVCYRFIKEYPGFVEMEEKEDEILTLDSLKETERFKYIDDDYSKGADFRRPLCLVNSESLTVNEAEAKGYAVIAFEGKEYLEKILKEI